MGHFFFFLLFFGGAGFSLNFMSEVGFCSGGRKENGESRHNIISTLLVYLCTNPADQMSFCKFSIILISMNKIVCAAKF